MANLSAILLGRGRFAEAEAVCREIAETAGARPAAGRRRDS